MAKTIAEWQKLSYECAKSKGFHDCKACSGQGEKHLPTLAVGVFDAEPSTCPVCTGTGLAPLTPTRIGSRLALIHREISEAVECVARGRMGLYYTGGRCFQGLNGLEPEPGAKPEGFGIELADVFLRLCDLAESLGVQMPEWVTAVEQHQARLPGYSTPEQIAYQLYELHHCVGHIDAHADLEHWADEIPNVTHMLLCVAAECGVDLLAMAELKHAYLTRTK